MKKNTIKGYLGGGKIKPMGYQGGGYIPGLSSSIYGMGLQRDVVQAQKDFEEQAKKVEKEQKKRGLFGKLGSIAGTALATALAPATGGLSLIAAKGIGSALGSGLGEMAAGKMYDAGDIKKSSTGLFGEDFTDLSKLESDMEKGGLGRALGAGASTALMAGVGELGKMGTGGLYNKLFKGKQVAPDLAEQFTDASGNLTASPEAYQNVLGMNMEGAPSGFASGTMAPKTGAMNIGYSQGLSLGDLTGADLSSNVNPFGAGDAWAGDLTVLGGSRSYGLQNGGMLRSFGLLDVPKLKTSGFSEETGKMRPDSSASKMTGFMKGMKRLGGLQGFADMRERATSDVNEKMNREMLMNDSEMMGDLDIDESWIPKTEIDYMLSLNKAKEMQDANKMYAIGSEAKRSRAGEANRKRLLEDMEMLGDVDIEEIPLSFMGFDDETEVAYQRSLPTAKIIEQGNRDYQSFQDKMRAQGYKGGGQVGGYGKGIGLLSMMPLNRRIV